MKKIFGIFFVVLLMACTSQNETITLNDVFEDKENNVSLRFEANMELSDSRIDPITYKTLRDSIVATTLGADFVKFSDNKILKKYAESSLATFVETTDSTMTGVELYTKIDGEIVYADEQYVSYRRILSTNSISNKKPLMTVCNYYVFDAKTGRHLQESDIFTAKQTNLMHKLLVERAKEMAHQNEIDINFRRVRPNGNFAILDSTIIYTFNPYEIAHPQIGFIEIVLNQKAKILAIN